MARRGLHVRVAPQSQRRNQRDACARARMWYWRVRHFRGSADIFLLSMDDARVNDALNELKSAKERLATLEKDQVALADRIAAARRAQRRIGFYLFGLVILFALVMAGAFTLLL